MKKLDLYILKKFLGTFFFMISLFVIIAIVFDISEKIDDFLEKEAPLKAIITQYYFSFIPWLYSILSSLLIFLAVILFTSTMAQRNEIVAILASGTSFKRMLLPYLISATLLFSISIYLSNFIIPITNGMKLDFENQYSKSHGSNLSTQNIHREIEPGTFIYMKNFNNRRLIGYKFSMEKIEHGKVTEFLRAEQIRWDTLKTKWVIENYHVRDIIDGKEILHKGMRKDTTLNFHPSNFSSKVNFIEALNYHELTEYIEEEKARGSKRVKFYEFEHFKRFAIPFSIFPLTLLAVSLASQKMKRGMGLHLTIGISLALVYVFLGKIAEVFCIQGGLPADWAVWTPNLIFVVIAGIFYWKAPK
jgi:lipopolysaccharide export system permease protein